MIEIGFLALYIYGIYWFITKGWKKAVKLTMKISKALKEEADKYK